MVAEPDTPTRPRPAGAADQQQAKPTMRGSNNNWRDFLATLRAIAAQARQRHSGLWFGGWLTLALSIPLALLGWWDERSLLGISVWAKPWKFHVSVGLHLLTLAWFAALLRGTPEQTRGLARMSKVALVCAVFELAYINWRAAWGEPSHFNNATPLAGALYALMGLGAVSLTACAGWLGWVTLRERNYAWGAVLQRGVGLGLLMGFLLGTLTGAYVSAQTGHHVGGSPTDAQGLPILRWSRDGGDLRVAHFFGLHAMHLLPAVAWLAARLLVPATAQRSLNAFAGAYAAFTVLTFAQALLGRPFI